MRDFVITTDSNSDIPAEYISKYNLTILPQYYAFGEDVYGDGKHLAPSEFYEKMREGNLPTSMANNPEVIRTKFQALLDQGYDILHVAFSSALSGSYNNVAVAAKELTITNPDARIEVIDTLNVSLGEAIMVLRAYEMKAQGKTLLEIKESLEHTIQNQNVWFTVNDLHHLQRGGRVSKATAVIGSMINIKPILYVNPEGKLISASTVRGRKKSLSTLVEKMESLMEQPISPNSYIGIVHGDCLEDALYAEKLIRERFGIENILVNDISPSIGTHAGPGALGVFFPGKTRE